MIILDYLIFLHTIDVIDNTINYNIVIDKASLSTVDSDNIKDGIFYYKEYSYSPYPS